MYDSIYNIESYTKKYENCFPNTYAIYLRKNRINILNNCQNILNKYIISKKINKNTDDVVITYYKKIPVKYWHDLYIIYEDLLEIQKLKLYKSKKTIIDLYIKIIPTLIELSIVRKKIKFNFIERFYYNYIYNMSNN